MARHLCEAATPLCPTFKDRYPLVSMAEYTTWIRPDGTVFDS
ncbi:hypothetical protein [Nocardiopsis sp. CC223A]|nr:hypothetical protein [Nocardiopsis sp. CC223A]